MQQTIIELWRGNINPLENAKTNNAELKKLMELINRNYSRLESTLGDEQKIILEKYTDCFEEYLNVLGEYAFCQGFSLGSKIIKESLED